MKDLEIKTQVNENGVVTIILDGSIDAYSYSKLEEVFNKLLAKQQYEMVVDLTGVDYLNSAGAGVFIGTLGVTEENNGKIVLVNPQSAVRNVFDLLGLSNVFSIVKDKSLAFNEFPPK
ncbi:MAG: STAS domain-containing protein [Planctomycetes bacterium]|nr:STAS domain-containing protein [Planctomycetota bacterium]